MTLMLEPTLAASVEDETQSLHAWSQEDAATEPVEYRRRGWKLPAAAAFVVVAGIIGGALALWHHQESATKTLVAPTKPQVALPASPPILAQNPDDRFLALVRQHLTLVSPKLALAAAHNACIEHNQGIPDPQIAQDIVAGTPGMDLRNASVFVDLTREVYCP